MATIKPLGDKILVRRLDADEKSKGGIILPEAAQKKPQEGLVIALGDGPLLDSGERADFQVKVDDRIIFSTYGGTEIKIEGQEFLVMEESDILAIVK